jgi:hypothetical protein
LARLLYSKKTPGGGLAPGPPPPAAGRTFQKFVWRNGGITIALAFLSLLLPPLTSATPQLIATAGPGYTISLTTGGRKVIKLKRGTYVVIVRDRSKIHNFHLSGISPIRFDKKTRVSLIGTVTWKVTLVPGVYRYACDSHPAQMSARFQVF